MRHGMRKSLEVQFRHADIPDIYFLLYPEAIHSKMINSKRKKD